MFMCDTPLVLLDVRQLRSVKTGISRLMSSCLCVLPVFCRAELVSPDRDHLRSGHLQLHSGGPPLPPGSLQEAARCVADAGRLQGALARRGQVTRRRRRF